MFWKIPTGVGIFFLDLAVKLSKSLDKYALFVVKYNEYLFQATEQRESSMIPNEVHCFTRNLFVPPPAAEWR